MNTNVDLITIGDASLDAFIAPSETETLCSLDTKECLVCFKYGDKIPVNSLDFSVGGNAANNAVGARRLGLHVAIVGTLGDDQAGKQIHSALVKENLILSYLSIATGSASNYSTVINYAGERTIFTYHAPKKYLLPEKLPACSWLYLTSLGEGWESVFEQVILWLEKHPETKLAFNPGSKQMRAPLSSLAPILSKTHLLYVNREEAEHFAEMTESNDKEKQLLSVIHQKGPQIVVVTDGPRGAYVYNGQSYLYAPVFPQEAIERTGAGDAFGSGCLSALAKGKTLEEGLLWGSINSASVISKVGAQAGLLHEEEIRLWAQQGSEKGIAVKEF